MRFPRGTAEFDVTDTDADRRVRDTLAAELARVDRVGQIALQQRSAAYRIGYQDAIADGVDAVVELDFEHENTITDGIPIVVDQD